MYRHVFVSVLLLLLLVACEQRDQIASDTTPQSTTQIRQSAEVRMPDFSLPLMPGGEIVSSVSFGGRVMLVTFFATWCKACVEEISTLKNLQQIYGKRGLSVVGISADKSDTDKMVVFLAKLKTNFPVLLGSDGVKKGFGGIVVLPTAFLVNRQGFITSKHIGRLGQKALSMEIEEMLDDRAE